ncbi:MAG: hypothetical protein ACRELT_13000, partial [Longimicrobiales bacterium]
MGRLGQMARLRQATWICAGAVIVAIDISRMYRGLHYPSAMIAGFTAGLAWLAFVASSVTAVRYFAPRRPETA